MKIQRQKRRREKVRKRNLEVSKTGDKEKQQEKDDEKTDQKETIKRY